MSDLSLNFVNLPNFSWQWDFTRQPPPPPAPHPLPVKAYLVSKTMTKCSIWSASALFAITLTHVEYSIFNIPYRHNYRTYHYKCTVKQFRNISKYLLLYKIICCWYPFELPGQVKAILMSTINICFYKNKSGKNIAKELLNNRLMKSSSFPSL